MSNRVKRWRIIRWDDRPPIVDEVPLECPHCGQDALAPRGETPGGRIIAIMGMALVFDPGGYRPPKNFMPDEIQCRKCRRIFGDHPTSDDEEKR